MGCFVKSKHDDLIRRVMRVAKDHELAVTKRRNENNARDRLTFQIRKKQKAGKQHKRDGESERHACKSGLLCPAVD